MTTPGDDRTNRPDRTTHRARKRLRPRDRQLVPQLYALASRVRRDRYSQAEQDYLLGLLQHFHTTIQQTRGTKNV